MSVCREAFRQKVASVVVGTLVLAAPIAAQGQPCARGYYRERR